MYHRGARTALTSSSDGGRRSEGVAGCEVSVVSM